RKREDLLSATEAKLQPILESVARGRLQGAGRIGMRVRRVLHQHKVGKHFLVVIQEQSLEIHRDEERILPEAELDGFYVIRTSVAQERLATDQVVCAYQPVAARHGQ
ncbi:MAG: transposase, partial [Candidatus Dormiibacterota bacterium]